MRMVHVWPPFDRDPLTSPGKADERSDVFTQQAAGLLGHARKHGFFQLMCAPVKIAVHMASVHATHHEEASAAGEEFLFNCLGSVMTDIVIRITDQQDRVARLMRAKLFERFMQRIPERYACARRAGFLDHVIDCSGAFLLIALKAFGENCLLGKDAEGDWLTIRRGA